MGLLQPSPDGRRRPVQLALPAVWLAVTSIGAWLTPDAHGHGTHEQLGLPPCPSVLLFDRPCPGCGLTTSWTALIHGQVGFAFHAHPLGPLLYLLFTLFAGLTLFAWWTKSEIASDSVSFNRAVLSGVVVFVAFGFVRWAVTPHYGSKNEQLLGHLAQAISRG